MQTQTTLIREPPTKLAKRGTAKQPVAVPTASTTSTGAPILRANAAQSRVPLPVRQTLLKSIYDHFAVLYQNISPPSPNLAGEHALKQEQEDYDRSTKTTYRHAVISSIGSIKQRELPDSITHPSVGTVRDLTERAETKKTFDALKLTRVQLDHLVMSKEVMANWGYITDIPEGVGGDRPSEEDKPMQCDRCGQNFQVKRMSEAQECAYHYGRPRVIRVNDGKERVYTCCSRPMGNSEGCTHGPHVFYESKPEVLHSRHAFTHTRPSAASAVAGSTIPELKDTALDVCCLDCEMVYSTGGLSLARVSVVDGSGKEVFDELVRLDDGVEVIDLNTRFSGIQPDTYASATLDIAGIRRALDALINSDTILIGHALDNDLKALRMIHHRCIDTVVLFPHRAGAPFRRSLKDLVKEHLGKLIQAGGAAVGHSSVEDSISTLDLVRFFVMNERKGKSSAAAVAAPVASLSTA